jgi:hypothetical protein
VYVTFVDVRVVVGEVVVVVLLGAVVPETKGTVSPDRLVVAVPPAAVLPVSDVLEEDPLVTLPPVD